MWFIHTLCVFPNTSNFTNESELWNVLIQFSRRVNVYDSHEDDGKIPITHDDNKQLLVIKKVLHYPKSEPSIHPFTDFILSEK